nr:hypothetical protein L203_01905 [Cryptococcus depauperatus CBS 7841]
MLTANTLALLSLITSVSAGGLSLGIGASINLGVSADVAVKASLLEKKLCSEAGSFLTEVLGDVICSSPQTRVEVDINLNCPFGWLMHKEKKCCLPKQEVTPCDCGAGFIFDQNLMKCVKPPSKCGDGQWWHERSGSCCDDSWEHSPPKGECPKGIECPTDWFWHKTYNKCFPLHPRVPEPDCNDWNPGKQCCGKPPGPHPTHGWGKRSIQTRHQRTLFPQTDLDRMYCPTGLHACTVNSSTNSEWSYECVDFATELESCGGCASSGEGRDCSAIPHALSVGCEIGKCVVYTCKAGFTNNGSECVAA